ncbi:DUF6933 domain-containing protein [Paenibacillus nasutitermitis]|uniref:DUF6933 domain-containing protein n=1 Tax=Paenibacillus nasutitermitis TaxID=1652958 RepID=A0A917DXV1_9BACL|nr:hypothetical protein [Paenibacillus nasutitermitis]GGD77938.1 hypothetical protein GCM10010911_39910 [Paenibacillus nasutitermitis]
MITISCTKKLFELSSWEEVQDTETNDELFKWHANVFRMAKRNNLIIMNNRTRYCFILFGIKKEHLKKFNSLFIEALTENLRADGFPESKISEYLFEANKIEFVKTYNRSVLGSMTDMVKITEFLLEDYWPIQEMNIIDLNKYHNQVPLVKLKSYPYKLMKEALGT